MPGGADAMLFRLAPYVSFCASFAVFLALPFADGWVALRIEHGRVLHPRRGRAGGLRRDPGRLRLGLEVVALRRDARGGPGGQLRSAAGHVRRRAGADRRHDGPGRDRQTAVRLVHATGSSSTIRSRSSPSGSTSPAPRPASNRAPFDLAEAESELVAGFQTEYSGFRWSIFFMAEYGSMFAVSGLAAILFFGGWNGPIPVAGLARPDARQRPACSAIWATCWAWCNFLAKAALGVTFMMWLRWTLPRLRIDQVMTTCLKYCMPLAAAMFVGAMLWTFVCRGGLIAGRPRDATVRVAGSAKPPALAAPLGNPEGGDVDPINWHSCFFLLFARDRLRLRRGGGRVEQHRADGVLPDRVAGRGGRRCSSWPGPISSARCN